MEKEIILCDCDVCVKVEVVSMLGAWVACVPFVRVHMYIPRRTESLGAARLYGHMQLLPGSHARAAENTFPSRSIFAELTAGARSREGSWHVPLSARLDYMRSCKQ